MLFTFHRKKKLIALLILLYDFKHRAYNHSIDRGQQRTAIPILYIIYRTIFLRIKANHDSDTAFLIMNYIAKG